MTEEHDHGAVAAQALSAEELLTTTRAVRRRLDLARPVARSVVEACLRIAFQAPNGSNEQGWGWVLVDDAATRRSMAQLYRAGMADHRARSAAEGRLSPASHPRISASVAHLMEHMEEVPVLVVPTINQRYGIARTFDQASKWGSILPAVWSFMLALRSRGLGSAWTTIHLYREEEMAELLGIPHPDQTQAGLFPVAYTIGTHFSPADRSGSEGSIFWNRWGSGA